MPGCKWGIHAGEDINIRNYILDMYIELEEPDAYSNRIATSLTTILFAQIVRNYSDTADMPDARQQNEDYTDPKSLRTQWDVLFRNY